MLKKGQGRTFIKRGGRGLSNYGAGEIARLNEKNHWFEFIQSVSPRKMSSRWALTS